MVSVPRQLLLQVVLILLNAFFAGTEIAVISLNTNKLKRLEEEGDKKAGKLIKMVVDPSKFLSTIQIGITLAGFLGSAFAANALSTPLVAKFQEWGLTSIPVSVLDSFAVIIITVILSFFTLVFGELVPKRIAQQKALAVAKFSLGVITVLSVVFKPLIWLISCSTNIILKILHLKTEANDDQVSEDDIRLMVDVGGQSGTIEEDEKTMIQNIFEFNDSSVYEIMTRQSDIIAFDITDTDKEILETIQSSGLSRFPVYEDDINNILGVLNSREFLINLTQEHKKSLKELLRAPYFVPETIKADQLFSDMQKSKVHIAVVIDEYGGTSGIITLEDLLEEIVGNIYDEYDKQEKPDVEKIGDNRYRIQGDTPLEDVMEELDITLPEDEGYDTIGGLVLSTLHTIPKDGQKFTVHFGNIAITVTSIIDHRIVETVLTLEDSDEKAIEDKSDKE